MTVITLNVQVKPECTDEEILRLTNWARDRCLTALSANSSNSPGYANGGVDFKTSQRPGGAQDVAKASRQPHQVELTVQVMRFEEDRALQGEVGRQSHGHGHGHSHGHDAHSHGHGEQGEHTSHVIPEEDEYEHEHEHEREPPHAHSHSHDAHASSHGHRH